MFLLKYKLVYFISRMQKTTRVAEISSRIRVTTGILEIAARLLTAY